MTILTSPCSSRCWKSTFVLARFFIGSLIPTMVPWYGPLIWNLSYSPLSRKGRSGSASEELFFKKAVEVTDPSKHEACRKPRAPRSEETDLEVRKTVKQKRKKPLTHGHEPRDRRSWLHGRNKKDKKQETSQQLPRQIIDPSNTMDADKGKPKTCGSTPFDQQTPGALQAAEPQAASKAQASPQLQGFREVTSQNHLA